MNALSDYYRGLRGPSLGGIGVSMTVITTHTEN